MKIDKNYYDSLVRDSENPELLKDIAETIIDEIKRHYEENVCRKD